MYCHIFNIQQPTKIVYTLSSSPINGYSGMENCGPSQEQLGIQPFVDLQSSQMNKQLWWLAFVILFFSLTLLLSSWRQPVFGATERFPLTGFLSLSLRSCHLQT